MFTFPITLFAGKIADLQFLQAETPKSTTASSYTFSSVNIGTAAADRIVLVCISALSSIDDRSLTGITIGGSAATLHANATSQVAGASSVTATVAGLLVPSGASTTVVPTFSNTMLGCCCHVYVLTRYLSSTPTDTATAASNASAASVSTTIDITGAGALLMCGGTSAAVASVALTGVTEDAETNSTAPGARLASGHEDGLATQSGRTLTVTPATNNNLALAGAVWR